VAAPVPVLRRLGATLPGAAAVPLLAAPAAAHVGSLGTVSGSGGVPTWYVLLVGGAAVGGSFLFTSLLTDHEGVRAVVEWRLPLPSSSAGARLLRPALALCGVAALVGVVAAGLLGPSDPFRNLAVLVVWAGWWAGFTALTYLVGDAWPAVNPFRALAAPLARLAGRSPAGRADREDDDRGPDRTDGGTAVETPEGARTTTGEDPLVRVGPWASVAGLLALVYVEVTSPVAEAPRLLAGVVLAYAAASVIGAVAVGPGRWFGRVDPVSRLFSWYGRLAPVGRGGDGRLELRLPGSGLARGPVPRSPAFVVALLWATTFDGLVSTAAWNAAAAPLVAVAPARVVYAAVLLAGFAAFLGAYRLAARRARRSADTYLTGAALGRRFAPSLVPIAAGYHLAHFGSYLLALSPALVGVLLDPLSPPQPTFVVIPGWFDGLRLLLVLGGHVVAVWVAHALALDLLPGRLRAVRSQYPLVAAMVAYTAVSLWIVSQPFAAPVGL
jgi:hypothetical protein